MRAIKVCQPLLRFDACDMCARTVAHSTPGVFAPTVNSVTTAVRFQ